MADNRPAATEHVRFTQRLASWIQRIAPEQPSDDLAADMADMIHAAADTRQLLDDLVGCDIASPPGRERAAQIAVNIQVQLEQEILHHVKSALPAWKRLANSLD